MSKYVIIVTGILVLILTTNASSQWIEDGTPICTAVENQTIPRIVADGSGGAIITWQDTRTYGGTGYGDIYAQKVNADGTVQWTIDAVAISVGIDGRTTPEIASDGAGGAIITWVDFRAMEPDIYAARASAGGTVLWSTSICTAIWNQWHPQIISDGSGGAIITWDDNRTASAMDPTGIDIYAQRVNASGTRQWQNNGVPICTALTAQELPTICSDGSGGAIVAWEDSREGSTNKDIYAQRINATGTVQWIENGTPICSFSRNQTIPRIVAVGSGGAVITWQDDRFSGSGTGIYAQKVNTLGTPQWLSNGVAISTSINGRSTPEIASDGAGGAIIIWTGFDAFDPDIGASRVNSSGTVLWSHYICTAIWNQFHQQIISDGSGGAIITWDDDRTATSMDPTGVDIYAQRVNASGASQWQYNGVPLCTAPTSQTLPTICSDGSGGAIVAWEDGRGGSTSKDIYAWNINATGSDTPTPCTSNYLSQNYPNPFNPATFIQFGLSAPAHVSLRIFDVSGRLVRVLVEKDYPAGSFTELWDGTNNERHPVKSGVYFYRLNAGSFSETKKLVLNR
jgi:predicted lipoprotein with Yx(FWY)xxD motif